MFVDKGSQGGVILFVESIRFFRRIVNQFRSKEICFHFLFINFVVFSKRDSRMRLTEKWSEKATVEWTLEILSLFALVKTKSKV